MLSGDPAVDAFVEVFVAVWIILFLASLVIGVVRLVRWVRRDSMVAALRRTGQRVIAHVTRISRDSVFYRSNYRTMWFVEAQWADPKTGISYQFRSEPLYRRQAKLYTRGERISVLVDPADPNRYYVERVH